MIKFATTAFAIAAASVAMFLSLASGSPLSIVLFLLAPLPLMVGAMGWGSYSGALGAILAVITLAVVFDLSLALYFLVTVAVPGWWLGHLALLGEETGPDRAPSSLTWYPVGRILAWIAGLAGVITLLALLTLGTSAEDITAGLHAGFKPLEPHLPALREKLQGIDPQAAGQWDEKAILDMLVSFAPVAVAVAMSSSLTLSLWLSARITAGLGRLYRPWPDLRTTRLPALTLVALFAAASFCFLDGLPGMAARAATGAIIAAYILTGFAVLHTLTLELSGRPFWLIAAYVIAVLFSWALIAVGLLGIADALFSFRSPSPPPQKGPPPL
ncbi:MAG: YybS family protein [Alphaproteobacteria bacterium]|nr:YybS family protein [Alphaproteobacteria bacterium]